eukprot:scaffold165_cov265-Prasinococcus_capsulatus_cf.AAC.8
MQAESGLSASSNSFLLDDDTQIPFSIEEMAQASQAAALQAGAAAEDAKKQGAGVVGTTPAATAAILCRLRPEEDLPAPLPPSVQAVLQRLAATANANANHAAPQAAAPPPPAQSAAG